MSFFIFSLLIGWSGILLSRPSCLNELVKKSRLFRFVFKVYYLVVSLWVAILFDKLADYEVKDHSWNLAKIVTTSVGMFLTLLAFLMIHFFTRYENINTNTGFEKNLSSFLINLMFNLFMIIEGLVKKANYILLVGILVSCVLEGYVELLDYFFSEGDDDDDGAGSGASTVEMTGGKSFSLSQIQIATLPRESPRGSSSHGGMGPPPEGMKAKMVPPPVGMKAKMGPPPEGMKAKMGPPPVGMKAKMGPPPEGMKAKMGPPPVGMKAKMGPPPEGMKAKMGPPPEDMKAKMWKAKNCFPPEGMKAKMGPVVKKPNEAKVTVCGGVAGPPPVMVPVCGGVAGPPPVMVPVSPNGNGSKLVQRRRGRPLWVP
ncbi:uncharacterized protein LOC130741063 isoform X1 [Lotus japonicus]|uniref:uncharacterized protein LOC130741063 isoform X1 n=1 Tax=Lotus japonicus TaxID=34305 RepID=UPI002582D6A6|nr:uncharacterized protein LOC130741063 isoform X1 [Lotus japonicus]